MNISDASSEETVPHAHANRWRYRFVVAAVFASVVALGFGTVNALKNDGTGKSSRLAPAASIAAAGAQLTDPGEVDCDIAAVLIGGPDAAAAAATAASVAGSIIDHLGVDIAVMASAGRVSAGAMIDDSYLTVSVHESRRDEVIDLLKDAIDRGPSLFDEEFEFDFEFEGRRCEPLSAFDDDLTLRGLFESDTRIGFETDDASCQLDSLFAEASEERSFDLRDIDLDDFDLDFNSEDGGFSVRLGAGEATLALTCDDF